MNITVVGKNTESLKTMISENFSDFNLIIPQTKKSNCWEDIDFKISDIIVLSIENESELVLFLSYFSSCTFCQSKQIVLLVNVSDDKLVQEVFAFENICLLPFEIQAPYFVSNIRRTAKSVQVKLENMRIKQLMDEIEREEMEQLRNYEKELSAHTNNIQYGYLFEQTPLGVVIFSTQSSLPVDFNELSAKMLGTTSEEFKSLKVKDWPFFKNEYQYQTITNNLAAVGHHDIEVKFNHEKGKTVYYSIYFTTINLFDVDYYYAVIIDITCRKLSEINLRNTQGLLSAAIEQSPLGIAVIDDSGYFRLINKKAEQIMVNSKSDASKNVPVKNILSKLKFKRDLSDSVYVEPNPILRAIGGEAIYNQEYIIENTNGDKNWIMLTAAPVYDDENLIHSTIVFFPDISELKQTLLELSEEKELMTTLMNNIPDLIFFKDSDSKFVRINKAMTSFLGIESPQAAVGRTDFEFMPSDVASKLIDAEQSILNSGIPQIDKIEAHHNAKGELFWLSTTKALIRDKSGQVNGIVGISRDITKLKLSEQHLKLAKEKAEESDKLKTAFLSNMSHEIRTPMNAIVGFAGLLTSPNLSEEKRESFVCNINESCENLLKLINDIIEIAKIQAGEVKITKTDIPLNMELNNVFEILVDDFEGKDVQLKLNISNNQEELNLHTDRVKIRQILVNLIQNARKFTEQGEVEFGYSIVVEKRETFVRFFVKDTGIGIPPDKLDIIFDTFRKVNDRNTRLYGGTGLGLTISKNLVHMLGGDMWVDSKIDIGSSFYFTIPYKQKENETPKLDTFAIDKFKKVLIVEDEELNYIYLYEILTKFRNIEHVRAKNGEEALKLIEEHDFDLVFMDIKMPIMNGIEATKIIKKKYDVPIIAQTAYAIEKERLKILRAGFDDYLTKPLTVDKIEKTLFKWLGMK